MSYKYRNPYNRPCAGTDEFKGCGKTFKSRKATTKLCVECQYRKVRWKAALSHRHKVGRSEINVCQICIQDVDSGHQCQGLKRKRTVIPGRIYVRRGRIQRATPEKCASLVNDILRGRITLV